jgi:hypothetical protein
VSMVIFLALISALCIFFFVREFVRAPIREDLDPPDPRLVEALSELIDDGDRWPTDRPVDSLSRGPVFQRPSPQRSGAAFSDSSQDPAEWIPIGQSLRD